MRFRRWSGRLAFALASAALSFVLLDLPMRAGVGACGLTPFRNSEVAGLPHELVPGRVTTYKGVEVRINSLGLRGPELVDPPAGATRVALVGDSVTFGNGVAEGDTLPASLERALAALGRPAQVLNGGVPAYNADNVTHFTRERILALAPAQIVWVMVANDVVPSSRKPDPPIPADAVIDPFAEFPLGSPLLQLLSVRTTALLRRGGVHVRGYVDGVLARFEHDGGDERLSRAIGQLRDLCAARGIAFGVAIYPYMVAAEHNPFRSIEDWCAERCRQLGVPAWQLAEAFPPGENLQRYWVAPLDGHPDGDANRLVAAWLAPKLAP